MTAGDAGAAAQVPLAFEGVGRARSGDEAERHPNSKNQRREPHAAPLQHIHRVTSIATRTCRSEGARATASRAARRAVRSFERTRKR